MAETTHLTPHNGLRVDRANQRAGSLRAQSPSTANPPTTPWRLILYIGQDSFTAVSLDITGNAQVGRGDSLDDYAPDLDLTPYGAWDAGVSRRHAILFIADGSLYVRDLDSTNGTHINGYVLEANKAYRVQAGDHMEFGNLQMTVHLIQPPE